MDPYIPRPHLLDHSILSDGGSSPSVRCQWFDLRLTVGIHLTNLKTPPFHFTVSGKCRQSVLCLSMPTILSIIPHPECSIFSVRGPNDEVEVTTQASRNSHDSLEFWKCDLALSSDLWMILDDSGIRFGGRRLLFRYDPKIHISPKRYSRMFRTASFSTFDKCSRIFSIRLGALSCGRTQRGSNS